MAVPYYPTREPGQKSWIYLQRRGNVTLVDFKTAMAVLRMGVPVSHISFNSETCLRINKSFIHLYTIPFKGKQVFMSDLFDELALKNEKRRVWEVSEVDLEDWHKRINGLIKEGAYRKVKICLQKTYSIKTKNLWTPL